MMVVLHRPKSRKFPNQNEKKNPETICNDRFQSAAPANLPPNERRRSCGLIVIFGVYATTRRHLFIKIYPFHFTEYERYTFEWIFRTLLSLN